MSQSPDGPNVSPRDRKSSGAGRKREVGCALVDAGQTGGPPEISAGLETRQGKYGESRQDYGCI